MGNCQNCQHSIRLTKKEKNCPNCGCSPYMCWKCNHKIDLSIEECKFCYYFVCNNCGECGKNCKINMIKENVSLIMKKAKEENNSKGLIRKIVNYISDELTSAPKQSCFNGVPISYAHSKLKRMALKIQGFQTKNNSDQNEFIKRFDEIAKFSLGYKWTIERIREEGSYGNEFREVSNMAICMGLAIKKEEKKLIKGQEVLFDTFERVNKDKCEYANWKNINPMKCKKCKKIYQQNTIMCIDCNKQLVEQKAYVTFCQLPRGEFQEVKTK